MGDNSIGYSLALAVAILWIIMLVVGWGRRFDSMSLIPQKKRSHFADPRRSTVNCSSL